MELRFVLATKETKYTCYVSNIGKLTEIETN
jgi:hypothetical protein